MKTFTPYLKIGAAIGLALAAFTGCESTGGGSSSANVGVYYGVGFYDPWYYGGYYDRGDIIVVPPGNRPDGRPRPEQPIAKPTSAPAARSTPSIPSAPRAMPSGGGGGGRR